MNERMNDCKFSTERVEMVAPSCTGTIIWCDKLKVEPTVKRCETCPLYEHQAFKGLVNIFRNL